MKLPIYLFVSIIAVAISNASPEDFVKEFDRLKKAGNKVDIQTFLEKASVTQKDNPDYYALAANYWWGLSRTVGITTKPSEEGDLSLRDVESGAEVGSIRTIEGLDPETVKRAVALLTEGTGKFPHRADIALGLAHIQNQSDKHEECAVTLLKLLEFSGKNSKDLRWMGNAQLSSDAGKFIPEAVQGYSAGFFDKGTNEFDALCTKICDATISSFPDHPYAYNIKAALANTKGLQDEALKFLEIAHSKAPKDPLILLNLGDFYKKSGKTVDAQKAYTKVIELDAVDDALVQQARDAMSGADKPQTKLEGESN
jgi:tetratricopeptide (TPR) repeat protein